MWLLMPSVLLVRQIPYRAMSLGLKVVICRWSSHACCSCVALPGLRDSLWSVLVLASAGGVAMDVHCQVRPRSPLSDGLLDPLIYLCSWLLRSGRR